MKKMFLLAGLFATAMFVSCSKDKEDPKPATLEVIKAENIKSAKEISGQGRPNFVGYVKYNLSENKVVEGNNWDIAFEGYNTLIVNGGTSPDPNKIEITANGSFYITEGTLENVTSVETTKLQTEKLNYKHWGVYDRDTHIIKTLAGKVIVIKTHDGKHVKLRIDSFYKDKQETHANIGYFSFSYVFF